MLDWLHRFDIKSTTTAAITGSPTKQRVLAQYMDRKKEDIEARHRLKLKEFD